MGNIHRRIYRDAHIRGLHGRRVVDAVAHIAHTVAVFPEHADDAGLLGGGELGKDRNLFGQLSQRLVIEGPPDRLPSRIRSTGSPTWRQMARVTFSLSPVRILRRRRIPSAPGQPLWWSP